MSKHDDFVKDVANELIEKLGRIQPTDKKTWNAQEVLDFPYNYITQNQYTEMNTLKLMIQPYDDPHWLTYEHQSKDSEKWEKMQKINDDLFMER